MFLRKTANNDHYGTILLCALCVFTIGTSLLTLKISELLLSSSRTAQSAEELVAEIDEFWFSCKEIADMYQGRVGQPIENDRVKTRFESNIQKFRIAAALDDIDSQKIENLLALSNKLTETPSENLLNNIEKNLAALRKDEVAKYRSAIAAWNGRATDLTWVITGLQGSCLLLLGGATYQHYKYSKQRKKTLQANAELARLVETSQESIFALDQLGLIQRWNPGSERMFGIEKAQAKGKSLKSLFADPEDSELISGYINGTTSNGMVDLKLRRSDGTVFDAAVSFSLIKDSNGKHIATTIVARDISEQVLIRREQSDFIASLTHDLKNPLVANNQVLSLILDGAVQPAKQSKLLSQVITSNSNMINMFSDMLELYKMNAGVFRATRMPVDLKNLLTIVVDSHSHHASSKGIKLIKKLDPKIEKYVTDPLLVRKIIDNLIDNSIKYSQSGCDVTISLYKSNDQLMIKVQDNGPGIKETQERFELSSNTTAISPKSSSNLGLYLSQKLAGYIDAHLSYGKGDPHGTIFLLALPCKGLTVYTASYPLTKQNSTAGKPS